MTVFEKRRISPGPDARVDVRAGRGAGEPRIHVDQHRAGVLRLADPLVGHRVVLGYVAAFHQDRLAMLHVGPVVGHRAPAEARPQTGDRGAVSKSAWCSTYPRPSRRIAFWKR
jgi:hypothetical protein